MLTSEPVSPSFRHRFRPEIELILCALRAVIDTETSRRVHALLQEALDWDYLVRTALKHSITALLFRSLSQISPDGVPAEIATATGIFMKRQHDFNLLLTEELAHILALLEARGIAAIPFKGPVLSALVYGDLGLRSYRDLDFLIHEQDFHRCMDALRNLDYRSDLDVSPAQEVAFRNYSGQDLLYCNDRLVAVEPHWAFGPSNLVMAIDYEGFWNRARPVDLAGTKVRSFSPEDLITVLCLHGSKEQWSRLQLICDVSETLHAYPSIDWNAVIARAREQRCLRMLLLGLRTSSRLLGTTIPGQALSLLDSDPSIERLARQVEISLFNERYVMPSSYSLSLFRLQMHDQFKDQMSYLVRTITTPRLQHFRTIRLPDSMFFLYYPVKLIHDYMLLPLWHARKFLFEFPRKLGRRDRCWFL